MVIAAQLRKTENQKKTLNISIGHNSTDCNHFHENDHTVSGHLNLVTDEARSKKKFYQLTSKM